MTPDQHTIQRLTQANRRLKLGLLIAAIVGVVFYSLATPEQTQAVHNENNSDNANVAGDKVGNAQMMVGIDDPDGFAVIVDEEGKVNIVTRNGRITVPKRKYYAD